MNQEEMECPYYLKCAITWKNENPPRESPLYKTLCGSEKTYKTCKQFQKCEKEKSENSLEGKATN